MNTRSIIIALATSLFIADGAYALTANVNGIRWTYNVSGGNASLGGGSSSLTAVPKSTSGAITIPSTLGGYPVTSIGDYAFSSCRSLTSVTIPDSVTSIGGSAFDGCRGLASVTIPDSVRSIGDYAFVGCSSLTSFSVGVNNPRYSSANGLLLSKDGKTLLFGVNGHVTIPDSVTSIWNFAFCSCDNLTSVSIPDSVTSIGYHAFYNCSGLTSVSIPNSVTRIGNCAFEGCGGLTSFSVGVNNPNYSSANGLLLSKDGKTLLFGVNGDVTIPNSVTSIWNNAFSHYSGLTSVTIPDSVTSIRDYAFSGCSGLTSVTIPDSVTSIGNYAFEGCRLLYDTETIPGVRLVDGWAIYYESIVSGNIDLTGIRGIGGFAFHDCTNVTSVTIPDSVTSIGTDAFNGCSGLTSVMIPDSVTSIGNYAFFGCSGLTSVTIPDSVTSTGSFAFSGCSGLTSVTIPDSVTSIGYGAFSGCSGLTSVTIPASVTSIGYGAFSGCSGLTSVTIPASVTSIGSDAFRNCSGLQTLHLPSRFEGNTGNLAIPNGCTVIFDYDDSSLPKLPTDAAPVAVTNAIESAGFADAAAVMEAIGGDADKYVAFKEWANAVKDSEGNLAGEAAVVDSPHAAVSWLLGAEALFENEPEIRIASLALANAQGSGNGEQGTAVAMTVTIEVKDGEDIVKVAEEKVAAMFEATSDLRDWDGAAKLSPTVSGATRNADNTMTFTVITGDGTAKSAFLRVKVK